MMFRHNISILLISLQSTVFFSATATGYSANADILPSPKSVVIVRIDKRLRSAFLRRASRQEAFLPAVTPAEKVAQLQRHFDAVLEILVTNEALALQIALDRLEHLRGESWTPSERAKWFEHLSFQRNLQTDRLELYRQRRLFPQNEHDASRAVPVFVDNFGTDCAVGHLMRRSGCGQAVDNIAEYNNLVYVTDVKSGPMVHWIAYSGLTQEEAALIQPGYNPPPFDAILSDLGSTGSVSHGGIRYENFSISATSSVSSLPVTIDTTQIGVAADNEPFIGLVNGTQLSTGFDDWLFIGGDHTEITSINIPQGSPGIVEITYSFDVVVEMPGGVITAASITNQPNFHFNFVNIGSFSPQLAGRIDIDTTVRARLASGLGGVGPILASLHIDSEEDGDGFFFFGNDFNDFAPQESVTVETTVRLENSAMFTSLTYSFQLVPEPTSQTLCLMASLSVVLLRRTRS